MNIDILSKNIEITDAIRVHVDDKMSSLTKVLSVFKSVSIKVEVAKPSRHHKKGDVFYAEANLKADGKLFRAESNNKDLYVAINEVRDELKLQISKKKEKVVKKKRVAKRK